MLIATWNVNSIRTRLDHVERWLDEFSPDLLCLQETKVDDQFFPKKPFESKGYKVSFYGQKSYNGVALISRHDIQDVRFGFSGELKNDKDIERFNDQKRVISALINEIRVVNLYVPNGSALNSEKYSYKIEWLKCLKRYLKQQALRDEPLCILGDFNIALEARDIHNPERLTGGIMASEAERQALKDVLGERLKDIFRVFEQEKNHWSWWDYRSGAWARDSGWRIDHIYLCEELIKNAKSCVIDKKERAMEKPSDHAPVLVDINWPPEELDDSSTEFNYN